jgi:hypothetical protein
LRKGAQPMHARVKEAAGGLAYERHNSIEEPALIERILAHVRGKAGSDTAARGPPSASA